jgi:hypothetical protein
MSGTYIDEHGSCVEINEIRDRGEKIEDIISLRSIPSLSALLLIILQQTNTQWKAKALN